MKAKNGDGRPPQETEIGLPRSGGTGRRPGDLVALAGLLIARVAGDDSAWAKERAEEIAREHGGDRIGLLKAARGCLAEEVARLEAELATEA